MCVVGSAASARSIFQGTLVTALEQRATCMAYQSIGFRGRPLPPLRDLEHQIGMILRDVVQVVRHAAADVLARIVPQGFQDRQQRPRVAFELRQSHGPRQPGP